jgi:hypothetical protein
MRYPLAALLQSSRRQIDWKDAEYKRRLGAVRQLPDVMEQDFVPLMTSLSKTPDGELFNSAHFAK